MATEQRQIGVYSGEEGKVEAIGSSIYPVPLDNVWYTGRTRRNDMGEAGLS